MLTTIVWRPGGAASRTFVTFRNAPGLPPTATCVAVVLPRLPAVKLPAQNRYSAQLVSRKVLSDTVCVRRSAAIVAIADINEPSPASLGLAPRVEHVID